MNLTTLFSPTAFAKFVSTNVLGTVVDTLALLLLATFVMETYIEEYILAPSLSFELAVINNYSLSYFWIWRTRVEKTVPDFLRRFFFYNLNSLLVFIFKLLLLVLISALLGLHVVYCNLIALTITGTVNFLLQDRLIFTKEKRSDG